MHHFPVCLPSAAVSNFYIYSVFFFAVFMCFCCNFSQTHTTSSLQHFSPSIQSISAFKQLQIWLLSVELSAPQGAAGQQNNAEQLVVWSVALLSGNELHFGLVVARIYLLILEILIVQCQSVIIRSSVIMTQNINSNCCCFASENSFLVFCKDFHESGESI